MGQYYKVINLDKRELLDPHQHDNGAKLMDHSYVGNNLVAAAEYLLSEGNPWHKTRLVWAGDYMDKGIFIEPFGEKGNLRSFFPNENQSLYSYAREHFQPILLDTPSNDDLRFLVNHTKKEVCDKLTSRDGDFGKIHPLPLLTSSGNGRGGGDFHDEENPYVGAWAGNVISVDTVFPDGFSEIIPDFFETY